VVLWVSVCVTVCVCPCVCAAMAVSVRRVCASVSAVSSDSRLSWWQL
jgi:hypothetical protein